MWTWKYPQWRSIIRWSSVCAARRLHASPPSLLMTWGAKPVSFRSEGPTWVYIPQTYRTRVLAFGCCVIYKPADALWKPILSQTWSWCNVLGRSRYCSSGFSGNMLQLFFLRSRNKRWRQESVSLNLTWTPDLWLNHYYDHSVLTLQLQPQSESITAKTLSNLDFSFSRWERCSVQPDCCDQSFDSHLQIQIKAS